MILHIVVIEPHPGSEPAALARAQSDLQEAVRQIPSIRRLRVGPRVRHGLPGYEEQMRIDFAYAAVFEFDDQAGLEAYLRHPFHATLARHFATLGRQALAYDYAVQDVGTRKNSSMISRT